MKCFYCEASMYNPKSARKADVLARAGFRPNQRGSARFIRYSRETKEHLVRKVDGGRGLNGNIVRACAWCNSRRGGATVEDHKEKMIELVHRGLHPVACPAVPAPPASGSAGGPRDVYEKQDG